MPLLSWAGSDVYLSHAEFLSSQGYELLLAAWLINHGAGMLETFQTQQGYAALDNTIILQYYRLWSFQFLLSACAAGLWHSLETFIWEHGMEQHQ